LQHFKRDPLPWGGDVTLRVAGNAGNAIFLAAHLIMAFFFTLERVYSSLAYLSTDSTERDTDNQELPTAIAGGAYLFIAVVQLLAIFWTQSRGPWLGLFVGIYLFFLFVFSALRPKRHRILTASWIGLGIVGIAVLVLMNTTSLFDFLRPIPYVGRFTQLLDQESNTAQVRILIWQGAAELVAPHPPLIYPDSDTDGVNAIRPLVGYGPEAMWVAYNPFYPPDLAHHEARNASPDRAHNETWDSLVITGVLGFVAYMALFVTIFYWALRWLGLLTTRRDHYLFAGLLTVCSLGLVAIFYITDGSQWRYFGVALPAGLLAGVMFYTMSAAFLHPHYKPERGDLPRLLLIIAAITTILAHFVEIHFGIAIAVTRTYFWVETALLLVVGMRWAQPQPFNRAQELAGENDDEDEETPGVKEAVEEVVIDAKTKKRRAQSQRPVAKNRGRATNSLPALPATVMTDLMVFFTFVFIYSTNPQGLGDALSVLANSITRRMVGGEAQYSPAILLLMLFTWLVAATVGLTVEALRQRRAPSLGWWLRGYGLHAAVVWIGWLIYGLIQGGRLVPGAGGTTLDEQLNQVAGHFAVYTWLVVIWIVATGTVYAWPRLADRTLPVAKRGAVSLLVGALLTVLIFFWINTVNVALVKADIIYKQGQQFDSQRNWTSSVELYRRALNARKTEDHYMLFLGRAFLERAKEATAGDYQLSSNPTIDEVLALTPQTVQQMGRTELLRAAETVLLEAQTINPLNTDHTANLARLYRSWSDLSDDAAVRQTMLEQSMAQYNMAVTLSPNAAHLWNEKGNAHLARGERDEAEAAYLYSLALDQAYDQTYLLLADFYDRETRPEMQQKGIDFLYQALTVMPNNAQLHSYLGVALADTNNITGAIEANQKVLELQVGNVGAMRNLILLERTRGNTQEALRWVDEALRLLGADRVADVKQFRQLAVEIYQELGQTDQVIAQYEGIRQLDASDLNALQNLSNLYMSQQNSAKALEVTQALIGLEPQNFQHPLVAAQAFQTLGQTVEARTFAEQALALAPAEQKPSIEQFIASLP
ncbi:MAG: O-antigen ligase family protein, partial [Chloroflexota bacterium]|nr:O-antigen ligase family protein [Chloroflexota bacterium]